MNTTRTVRLTIYGAVQGVGFRYNLRDRAQRAGVVGWCANRSDGCVEAVISGAEGQVALVEDWCRTGPSYAEVERVEREVLPGYDGPSRFEIRR